MWQNRIRLALIIVLVTSFIFIQLPNLHKQTFASASIVQLKCNRVTSVSNNQNISLTLNGVAIQSNVIAVTVSVQGQTSQVINYVNVSDGHSFYPQRIRTTDFGNTLIVAIFSGLLNYSGVTTIYTQYHAASNLNNQVVFCAYEISGLTSAVPTQTTHQEGGNQNLPVGSSGDIIISGSDYNTGSGANIAFTGTQDSIANINIALGHNIGTYTQTAVTFSVEADASFTQLITTVTFTQSGIVNFGGLNVLVINTTKFYTVTQLPVTFIFTASNVSDTIKYGYFSTVGNYNWQSLSGCGQSLKDNTFQPSISGSCTVTAIYSQPTTQNSSIIIAIINQIFRVAAYLIPSLIILFSFLYLGIKTGMHGDMLFIMYLFAIGTLSALTSFLSGTFVPFYVGIISIVFSIVGFIYYKRR